MPDMEKVISILSAYKNHSFGDKAEKVTVEEIITMLKAQEPVEPVVDVDEWRCGNCGHKLEHQELLGENVLFHEQYSYCSQCGRPVKWE